MRTDLANERTLLAYTRTALMVSVTGATLIKFFPDEQAIQVIAWGFVAVGLIVLSIGAARFGSLRKRLHRQ